MVPFTTMTYLYLMTIKGHKERALLRRGHHIQEALKRRVNINELYSLRRNALTESEEDEAVWSKETVNLDDFCEGLTLDENGKCPLKVIIDEEPTIDLRYELLNAIRTVYQWYRTKIKNDNRTLFKNTMNVILKNENPSVAIKLIAAFLTDTSFDSEHIARALKSFVKADGVVDKNKLAEFLKDARAKEYSKYEKSFEGNDFELVRGYIELSHGFTEPFYNVVIGVLEKKYEINNVIKVVTETILKTKPEDLIDKADLNVKSDLTVGGQIVIPKNAKVEVKKMDYRLDSYFSEFFAIYKNPKKFQDYINNQQFRVIYNYIIDGVYLQLKEKGQPLIDNIKKGFDAIIYENNIIILKDDIDIYWSNKGQRSCGGTNADHRLSLRYKLNKPEINSYIYKKNTTELVPQIINVVVNPNVECPVTV